jgi:hypothetical protein
MVVMLVMDTSMSEKITDDTSLFTRFVCFEVTLPLLPSQR